MALDNVEDIWELSPLQQGILFHCLYEHDRAGLYLEQFGIPVPGPLNCAKLRAAWQAVVDRHAILRTAFFWEEVERPLQVVHRKLEVPFSEHDLRGLEAEAQAQTLAQYRTNDQERGFDLSEAPLLRVAVFQLHTTTWHVILSFHHILLDGWSLMIVFREVAALYAASLNGETADLEPPCSYGKYISWLQQRDLAEAEAYWRRTLHGYCPGSRLPIGRPDAEVGSAEAHDERSVRLPSATTAALQRLARSHQITLNAFLQGAWAVLLYRYIGEDDVVFGATVSGRRPEIESVERMVGLLVNTLPVRARIEPDWTAIEWLKRLNAEQFEARAYDYTPLAQIQTWAQVEPGRPLFESILGFENYPTTGLSGVGDVSRLDVFERTNYPITIIIVPGDELWIRLLYSRTRFEPAMVTRLLNQLITLLKHIAEHPECRVGDLPILSAPERRQILTDWNQTRRDFPKHDGLDDLFLMQVRRTPDATAIRWNGPTITYSGLDRAANRIAHAMRERSIGPGTPVGVLTERSIAFVTAILAIIKAGGAYVPLDPAYPTERLVTIADDAELNLILADKTLLSRLGAKQALAIDLEDKALSSQPDHDPKSVSNGDSLAYVIYTSGSTGRPKGVEVVHRGVSRLVLNTDYVALAPGDRVAQASTTAFDAATFEIWGALLNGGTLVGIDRETLLSPVALARKLIDERVDTLFITTELFHRVADERPDAFGTLRDLLVGGSVLDSRRAHAVLRSGRPRRFLNIYGPTECTTYALAHEIMELPPERIQVPIGKPIANTEAYVVDKSDRPVPIGVPGELYLAGPGLARGYRNQPDVTAQRFVSHPFDRTPGARCYRTGDKVRYREDGAIEFLGRFDAQVKIRGFRVEPGEVEAMLREHPALSQCAIIVQEDTPGDRRLVAYVVPHPEHEIELSDGSSRSQAWQQIYDHLIYADLTGNSDADPTFNLSGWISSYTGEPIGDAAMREQVDRTVEAILALKPQRVLEIGCGTGLLLFRLAPTVQRYVGTDYSNSALAFLRNQVERRGFNTVELHEARAEDLTWLSGRQFDTAVMNSVVQYFDNIEHLITVIDGVVERLGEGGRIFIGDIRALPLLDAQHASVALFQADRDLCSEQLRPRISSALTEDHELVIDPSFFPALRTRIPRIARVEIGLKRGTYDHELTRFRYNVVLHLDHTRGSSQEIMWRDWKRDELTLENLRRELDRTAPRPIGFLAVPNRRVAADVALLDVLRTDGTSAHELKNQSTWQAQNAIDPEELWRLAAAAKYTARIGWSRTGGASCFDAVLVPDECDEDIALPIEAAHPTQPWRSYANETSGTSPQLAAALRRYLERRLPSFMIPAAFVPLPSLPLLPSGKLDRSALPRPGGSRGAASVAFIAPAGRIESTLASIWAELLGIPQIGLHDNFFSLGGHSLLATQIVSRARAQLGVDLPLRALFERPTISGLAKVVRDLMSAGSDKSDGAGMLPPPRIAIDVDKLSDEEVENMLAGFADRDQASAGRVE
jgi:amino acid adenylation domain-containing protein